MRALRFVVVIFFYHIIFVESFKISRMLNNFVGSDDTTSRNDESSNSDEDDSQLAHVDCSDVKSKLGRAVKWVFVATSKSDIAPNVRFFLSSRTQPTRVEVHAGDAFRLDATDFKPDRRTVLLVHGFKSGAFKRWVQRMEEALLLWGDVNIIVVDWERGSKSFNYYYAAVNTKTVGNQVARFLHGLMSATNAANSPKATNWGPLHLVGHSLGAHISGIAARDFKEMQNSWRVSRITGLDPAKLCFRNVSLEFRLDRTDADFVDVIHTSANSKSTTGFGIPEPIGHADFYANGGNVQPGCARRKGSVWKYIHVPKTPVETAKCSHQRAYHYFTESVVAAANENCTFWAYPWDPSDSDTSRLSWETCNIKNCTEMGIRAENYPQRGTFYATTSGTVPYCIKSSEDEILTN